MGYKFLYSINGDSNYVMYDSEDVEKTVVEDFEKAWIYMKSGEILKVEGSEQISRILCEMRGGRYVKELVLDHPQMYDVFQKIEDENSFHAFPTEMIGLCGDGRLRSLMWVDGEMAFSDDVSNFWGCYTRDQLYEFKGKVDFPPNSLTN